MWQCIFHEVRNVPQRTHQQCNWNQRIQDCIHRIEDHSHSIRCYRAESICYHKNSILYMASVLYCSSLQAYLDMNYCMPPDPTQPVTNIRTIRSPPKQSDDHVEMSQAFERKLSLELSNKVDQEPNDSQKQDPKTQSPNWLVNFLASHQSMICDTRFGRYNFQ